MSVRRGGSEARRSEGKHHVPFIVLPGEGVACATSRPRTPHQERAAMLTPGERLFRRMLHIVIALLLAGTAILAALERMRGAETREGYTPPATRRGG